MAPEREKEDEEGGGSLEEEVGEGWLEDHVKQWLSRVAHSWLAVCNLIAAGRTRLLPNQIERDIADASGVCSAT